MTSALRWGVGGQHQAPATLPPGKDALPTVQETGWAPGSVWTGAKNIAPTGIRSLVRPARSESLYRLSYPSHCKINRYYIFWVCACSLSYLARNVHAPYCHLYCLTVPNFAHYLIHCTIFRKIIFNLKCVFWFSVSLVSISEMFFMKEELNDMIKNVNWSSRTVPAVLVRF